MRFQYISFQFSKLQYRMNQMLLLSRREKRQKQWCHALKSRSFKMKVMAAVLLLLVLLSGDVEMNPGPTSDEIGLKEQCPVCSKLFSRLRPHIKASHKDFSLTIEESGLCNISDRSHKLKAIPTNQNNTSEMVSNSLLRIPNSVEDKENDMFLKPGPSTYNSQRIHFPNGRDPRYLRPIYTYDDDSDIDNDLVEILSQNQEDCLYKTKDISIPYLDTTNQEYNVNNNNGTHIKNSRANQGPSQVLEKSLIKCLLCGGYYKENGLNIHLAKAHPEESRRRIVEKYTTKDASSQSRQHDENINLTCTIADSPLPKRNNKKTLKTDNKISQPEFQVDLENWVKVFANGQMCDEDFDKNVEGFQQFLAKAIHMFPGPKHPAQLYYEARRKGLPRPHNRKYKDNSNPMRKSKKEKEKRKAQYEYKMTQFLYYNQRRKAVRKVLNEDKQMKCTIDIKDIHQYFSNKLSIENSCTRSEYEDIMTTEQRLDADYNYKRIFKAEDIKNAVKKMRMDTAAGPDGVLMRSIKNDKVAEILAVILNRMLQKGHIPKSLRKARTVLIYKNGDPNNLDNWRPISITSVIRRVIERVIEKDMRQYININENQRGFTNTPGCQINIKIIDETLEKAKKDKQDVTIIFLDIQKAFDSVGHKHLEQTIKKSAMPNTLQKLVLNLALNNETQFQVGLNKSKTVKIAKGVFQGSPLSPLLYNMSTDFILQELSEPEVANAFGFRLVENENCVSILGFADDTVLIANSKSSAEMLTGMAISRFKEIGLNVNFNKSHAICIENGQITKIKLMVDNEEIKSIGRDEKVKYLGVNLCDELKFDSNGILMKLSDKLNNLSRSILLSADQKLNIINQYVAPTLIYPLQNAKLKSISKKFLEDGDKLIRSTTKEILQLPSDTPNGFLYSDRKYKGLGIMKIAWEAYIQQFNSLCLLEDSKVNLIPNSYENDKVIIFNQLNIDISEFENIAKCKINGKHLRKFLKEKEFSIWANHSQKGKGVILYKEVPIANSWVYNKNGLSSSEWRDCLKMTCNVAAVRTVPGRGPNTNRCRHCDEYESLAHVLGSCRHSELLVNKRHNEVRSIIAKELKKENWEVYEEIKCISDSGSTRRIDILAINRRENKGFIIDPTIRFETNLQQPEEVDKEKKTIYEPTIPYFQEKYKIKNIYVIGLLFGSRGTLNKNYLKFRKTFKLPKSMDKIIVSSVLKSSVQILRNHLFNQNSL